jgi:nuclear migration protein JNM1
MHFMGAAVDARDVNFSDSISTKRQAYRSKSKSRRRRRMREDGTEEVGDFSDSEDESLERRLARLRREVEELKVEMANEATAGKDDSVESGTGQATAATEKPRENALGDGVAELSRALDNLHASSRGGQATSHSAAAMLSQKLGSESGSAPASQSQRQQPSADGSASAVTTVPAPAAASSAGILSHAAAFESRLALIEASMGISSSSNPFVGDGISEPALQPVLPSLDQLTSRLSALTGLLVGSNPAAGGPSAVPGLTTPHLEALSTRVRKLTTDAEALASARRRAVDAAKAAQAARISSSGSDADAVPTADGSSPSDDDNAAKIQALYATLPTIQSLHPLLPSVLERLRSLRACHAGAAHAADSLDALEKRQAEMTSEIEQWREGLTAVEEKMRQGEAALKSNVETVEPWVRDLESRMARLGGPPGSL